MPELASGPACADVYKRNLKLNGLHWSVALLQVLVATDVAARGLDIRLLPYVVNYDFPSSLDTYIHR
jgi:superfamily II DNA/RNA helicase